MIRLLPSPTAEAIKEQLGSIILTSALSSGGAITEHVAESDKRNKNMATETEHAVKLQHDFETEKQVLDESSVINLLR